MSAMLQARIHVPQCFHVCQGSLQTTACSGARTVCCCAALASSRAARASAAAAPSRTSASARWAAVSSDRSAADWAATCVDQTSDRRSHAPSFVINLSEHFKTCSGTLAKHQGLRRAIGNARVRMADKRMLALSIVHAGAYAAVRDGGGAPWLRLK